MDRDAAMECNHVTLREWNDPATLDMHLQCQECGKKLILTRAELIHARSERGEFRLSYRVSEVFGDGWGHHFWSQTRHGKKRSDALHG